MKKNSAFLLSLFVLIFASCSQMVSDFSKMSKEPQKKENPVYTVQHHFEIADKPGEYEFSEDYSNQSFQNVIAGESTEAAAYTRAGFIAKEFEQQIVNEDGSTVISIYYERKTVKLTLDPDGGLWTGEDGLENSEPKTITGKYGFSITTLPEEPVKTDWGFIKWIDLPKTFPAEDCTYKAEWSQTFAEYKVQYWFEKADCGTELDYEADFEQLPDISDVTKKGEYGIDEETGLVKCTNADFLTIDKVPAGFEAKEIEQQPLNADGSTVVKVYYTRRIINIAFDGTEFGSWDSVKTASGKYGSQLTAPETDTLIRIDYEFAGWSPELPEAFPAEDTTFTALWNKVYADYSIEYYYETADSSKLENYTKASDESFVVKGHGLIGALTQVEIAQDNPAVKPGFEAPEIIQTEITQDDSSVVVVKFARKIITVTLNPNGGKWSDETTASVTISGKFGSEIASKLPENPVYTNSDYVFVEWKNMPLYFPAQNTEYLAFYSQSAATYKVQYWAENADSTDSEDVSNYEMYQEDSYKGEIGALVTAKVLDLTAYGFECKDSQVSAVVAADGSTILVVYYTRKNVKLTFKANGGSWDDDVVIEGKYGALVQEPDTSDLLMEDYEFAGWDAAVPSEFPLDNAVYTAQWNKVNAKYTIKKYFEKLSYDDEADKYGINEAFADITEKGVIGQMTSVSADSITGFDAPVIEDVIINADDSSVVKVYYNRSEVTLTVLPNGGTWADGSTSGILLTGKYGTPVDTSVIPAITRTNYVLSGEALSAAAFVDSVYPAEDKDCTVLWTQIAANYTVKHWFEKADSLDDSLASNYEQNVSAYEDQTLSGSIVTQTQTAAAAYPDVAGFTAKDIDQTLITADNNTVVNVYYKRNIVSVKFDPNGGKWADGTTEIKTVEGRYGSVLTAPSVTGLVKENYALSSESPWGTEICSEFPLTTVTYTANWIQTAAAYSVKYLFENAENSDYVENSSYKQSLTGQIGELNKTAVFNTEPVTGFNAAVIENPDAVVQADTVTVYTVKYSRKVIELTLDAGEGHWTDGSTSKVISGKYGAAITDIILPQAPVANDSNYAFVCWTGIPKEFPAENGVYYANYSQESAQYTVYHYQEKADSLDSADKENNYTLAEWETVTVEISSGNVYTDAAAQKKSYTGFTYVPAEDVLVSLDNTTCLMLYYTRNIYTMTFKPGNGAFKSTVETNADGNVVISGKYEAEVSGVPADGDFDYQHYEFAGWDSEPDSSFPATNKVYTAAYNQTEAKYSVVYKFEAADGDSYNENSDLAATIEAYDTIGQIPEIAIPQITGFEAGVCINSSDTITQAASIASVGTIYQVQYNRKNITLTFAANGGNWCDISAYSVNADGNPYITGKYGALVTGVPVVSLLSKEHYNCTGWTPSVASSFPSENVTYNAQWEKTASNYTIKYYFENVNDSDYSQNTQTYPDVTSNTGTVGQATTYSQINGTQIPEVTGFALDHIENISSISEIENDTTEGKYVKVYYKRNQVVLTFDANGGSWENGYDNTVTGKYGAAVILPDTSKLTREDYELAASVWNPSVSSVFPAANAVYEAQWKKVNSYYTIQYYFENANNTEYVQNLTSYPDVSTQKAAVGSNVTQEIIADFIPEVTNYKAGTADTILIVETDSLNVIKIKYARKLVTYTFDPNGGIWSDDTTASKTISGKWGSTISSADLEKVSSLLVSKENWKNGGWNPAVGSEYGTSDETFVLQWYSDVTSTVTSSTATDLAWSVKGNKQSSGKYMFSVKVPYTADWTYKWYVDRVLQEGLTEYRAFIALDSGIHNIMCVVNDGINTFNTSMSYTVN